MEAWKLTGAIDSDHRLTDLGVWGLPRALAWAWGADLDLPPAGVAAHGLAPGR